MLSFQPITAEAIRTFEPYLCGHNGRFCDFTPANLYVWRGYYYKGYALTDGLLVLELCGERGETYYSVPMGEGDKAALLRKMKEYLVPDGDSLRLSLIPQEALPLVYEVLGRDVQTESERDWCDYLYDAQAMAAFAGAAYAKQRNHVRRFERLYPSCRFERLSPSHLPLIEAFLDRFAILRNKDSSLAEEEIARTRTALNSMEELGLFGIVLFVEDCMVGFSAGSRVGDTVYVNFEKADTSYDGVYQKLVQGFASTFVDDTVLYINREEDCGDEGLRKSKLSYHPTALLEKYTVTGR